MRIILSLLLLSLLAACSNTPSPEENQKLYKVGKPYTILGQSYEPKEDPYYDEVGEASWYGPGFHGRKTANGERFDKYDLTAAHRTLPMPSVVKVTNLENGKSINLRVNDRGPFAKDRIIDVSKKAARILGFEEQGMAHVRVQFLPEETAELFGGNMPEKLKPRQYASYGTADARTIQKPEPIIAEEIAEEPVIPRQIEQYGSYRVQVGTFRVRENARRVSNDVSRFGVAQMKEIEQEGERLYQVRVGAFKTMSDAEAALNLIQQSGYQDALLTQN
jgi:rare lipoprotein A